MRWLAYLLLSMLTGCIQIQDFDPVGNAARISGSWTIDGRAATEGRCDRLGPVDASREGAPGADRVRVAFLDGIRPVVHGGLVFECRAGGFATESEVVREGTWTIQLQATRRGVIYAVGPPQVHDTESGHIVLDPVDFDTAVIRANFAFGDEQPTSERCSELGVEEVRLRLLEGDGPLREAVEPCGAGVVAVRVVPGNYVAQLDVIGVGGVSMTMPEAIEAVGGETRILNGGAPIDLLALP